MKNNTIRKILDSRIFWGVIALIIALAMWVYVTSQNSDEFKRTFRSVRVEFVGEDNLRQSRNMVITGLDYSTVTVEVVGPRRIVSSLSENDLVAQVDVSRLTQAAYTSQAYTVVFPDGSDVSLLQTTSRTPETVNFMVSNLVSRTIQVRGSFDGSLADGYTAETPQFEPSTITISGPEAYIKDVDYAWVSFGAENVSQTYSVETGFTLMDKDGNSCSIDGISFSDDVVTATLPILVVKDIPLTVELISGGGATADNARVTIEPYDMITLAGDSATLARKNRIVLATIDLGDFTSSFTDSYAIPLDDDTINMTGITEAKVTVEIIGLTTKTFTIRSQNLSCINVTDGYTYDILSENLDVVLRGPAETLDRLGSENITAVADLLDYKNSVGTYMPEVSIYIDGFSDVGAVGNYTISVELKKEES